MDAAFLQMETAETPMHLGSVHMLELPPDYEGDFPEELMRHVESRLHLAPMLTRKLVTMPFDLANPVWVHDDDVEVDYHVRRVRLPAPGSQEQLFAVVGRLHSIVMDRTRPLWEMVLIEGVNGDGYALYLKVHHAGLDGMSGQVMVQALYDVTAVPRKVGPPPRRRAAAATGGAELFAASLAHAAQQSIRLMTNMPESLRMMGTLAEQARDLARPEGGVKGLGKGLGDMGPPRLSFNTTISNQRLYAAYSAPLADMKAVAKACGVTLNDMVLAMASGALRRYLQRHGELPSRSLVGLMPMSLREADDKEMTNRVTMAACDLHTQIEDPLERLKAISASTAVIKRNLADTRKGIPSDVPSIGMPWLVSGMSSLAGKLRLADLMPPMGNVVISNVPTSPVSLYLAGARLATYWPILILTHGQGLGLAVQSYAGAMEWGVLGCRRAMADTADLVDDLAASLDELKEAALSATAVPAKSDEEETPAKARKPRAAAGKASAAKPTRSANSANAVKPARKSSRKAVGTAAGASTGGASPPPATTAKRRRKAPDSP